MENSPLQPLEWIRLELIPLPDKTDDLLETIVWWNYETGEIVGDAAQSIIDLINAQVKNGSVSNSNGTIELSDPFKKTTEMATVLGQYFWVIPVPVSAPFEHGTEAKNAEQNNSDSLQ